MEPKITSNKIEKSDTADDKNGKDSVTEAIGGFGLWHLMLLLTMTYPIKISAVLNNMGIIFMAPKTYFYCADDTLQGVENQTCYSNCSQYKYYTEFENSIISEWDLVCTRGWLANFNQTVTMLGVSVGSILFGYIADRRGRRPALLIASVLHLIAGFAVPYCPDYWTFTAVRFFTGFANAGSTLLAYTLMMEMSGQKNSEIMNFVCGLPVTLGEMVMPAFAYYLRSWDKYSLGIALPNIEFLVLFFLVPESPKWLISVGRLEEASVVMEKIAKWNNLPKQNMLEIATKVAKESSNGGTRERATYLDLMRPNLRTKNICSCINWFILGISFYGLNQYIGQTSSNPFLSIFLAGTLQVPGSLLNIYLCKRYGRRITLITFLLICSVSNALMAIPDEYFYAKLIIGSVGISSASGAFAAVYVYTTELFPTVTRNMAMGASSTTCRFGSMIAPFIAGLNVTAIWAPPVIFATMPLIAVVACYCLPETKGVAMNDHVEK